jgi:NAD(P)-dependent dehydrogenase (short-subunit alcohol dehydrogenase family)
MTILITGGTSGLGLALVRSFLKKGCYVVTTGRQNGAIDETSGKLTFIKADFCKLRQTADTIKSICRDNQFDIVVNNAGVLSPPDFIVTDDGNEYSFQVNFLAHLMINEIIVRNLTPGHRLRIAAIVSLAYRMAHIEPGAYRSGSGYRPFKAYSNSKLYLTLMCSWLAQKYQMYDLKCFGFDPGVFNSGIYRMQKKWFRLMYRIAGPFMRDPRTIAEAFCDLIERDDLVNGAIYKPGRLTGIIPETEYGEITSFMEDCFKMIEAYLR